MISHHSSQRTNATMLSAEELALVLARTPVNVFSVATQAVNRSLTRQLGVYAHEVFPNFEGLGLSPRYAELLRAYARDLDLTPLPDLPSNIRSLQRRERLLEDLAARIIRSSQRHVMAPLDMNLDQTALGPREGRKHLAELIFEELWKSYAENHRGGSVPRHECAFQFMILLKLS